MFLLLCVSYLDHKIDVSLVLITGDRSVGSDHQIAVHLGWQVHVLTWCRGQRGGWRVSRFEGMRGQEKCGSIRPVLWWKKTVFKLPNNSIICLYYYFTVIWDSNESLIHHRCYIWKEWLFIAHVSPFTYVSPSILWCIAVQSVESLRTCDLILYSHCNILRSLRIKDQGGPTLTRIRPDVLEIHKKRFKVILLHATAAQILWNISNF